MIEKIWAWFERSAAYFVRDIADYLGVKIPDVPATSYRLLRFRALALWVGSDAIVDYFLARYPMWPMW